eukprot:Hpha_TRINITY_DN22568_c0_g1::TRINITY_DN22568_c0_g1_i1::g.185089::m.185089/K20656/TMEM189; transmembrane protein 189
MDELRARRKQLAAGYSSGKRNYEVSCVAAGVVLWISSGWRLAQALAPLSAGVVAPAGVMATLLALLVADFLSGLVHWACDTYGSVDSPAGVVLRSFREHHLDATAITRHDFIEVNGDTFALCVPVLFGLTVSPPGAVPLFARAFLQALAVFVAFTNEFHKTAHLSELGKLRGLLVDSGLVITKARHNLHHQGLHDTHYCITTGWMNAPLEAICFWRAAEKFVMALTGVVPRACSDEALVRALHKGR